MTKLQCRCGHAILCKVRRLGECLGSLVFFDGEKASETYQERVVSCPGCGERLGLVVFFVQNQPG
jgi:DNA-directed RNA polymerase subunit RPC12/RpoP